MDQEQQDGQQQQSDGPTTGTKKQVLLWTSSFLVALAFLSIVICGYLFGWKWTGLPKQTFWDWLSLLIIPAVLAIGGFLFTRSENQRTQKTADQERALDREIADGRRQDDTLQAYLDGMSQLLTDKELPLHRAQSGDSVSTVARARTLTVLGRLDRGRKRSVVQFLFESGLIYKEHTLLNESDLIERRHNIVSLKQADLREVNLHGAYLREADLDGADLVEADLRWADLREANLSEAVLYWAVLGRTEMYGADLSYSRMSKAKLSNASLGEADLHGADLRGADLREANLGGAHGWTEGQLSEARTLKGVTMPDEQILEGDAGLDGSAFVDWIKNKKAREEDE